MADSKTFGFLKGNLAGIPDVSRRGGGTSFTTGPLSGAITGSAATPGHSGKKGVAADSENNESSSSL